MSAAGAEVPLKPCNCNFCTGREVKTVERWRRKCKHFKALKKATTRLPYIDTQLKPCDEAGYAAAGIMLFRKVVDPSTGKADFEVLMAREVRAKHGYVTPGGDQLNFLGGKRHRRIDRPLDVAINKLDEETGYCLRRSTIGAMRGVPPRLAAAAGAGAGSAVSSGSPPVLGCPLVVWAPTGIYALYCFFAGPEELDIDIRAAGVGWATRLQWVTRQQLQNLIFEESDVHFFCKEMIDVFEETEMFGRLDEIWRLAAAEGVPAPHSSMPEAALAASAVALGANQYRDIPLSKADAARFFDVLSTVRLVAREACPLEKVLITPLPFVDVPSWSINQIREQFAVDLTPEDIEKLRLRFRPHYLQRTFGRELTEKEERMSSLACRVIDSILPAADDRREDDPTDERAPGSGGIDPKPLDRDDHLRQLHRLIEAACPGAVAAADQHAAAAELQRKKWVLDERTPARSRRRANAAREARSPSSEART